MISANLVKELREKTGVSMMDCKNALTEAKGDMSKAIEVLRKSGIAKAEKKSIRATKEGFLGSYIHSNGKVGVMVEVNCETDFVAKNPSFQSFTKDLAMQVAAANPLYVKREDVPLELVNKEKEIHMSQIGDKPLNIKEKIVQGKLDKYFSDICLLEQKFVKDDKITIQNILTDKVNELGENILIKRFIRFQVGE